MSAQKKKLRLVNLIPKDEFETSTLGRVLKWLLTSFRVIVIIVEFVVVGSFLSRFYLDAQIADYNDKITQRKTLIESFLPIEEQMKSAQKKLEIYASDTSPQDSFAPVLKYITSRLPTDVAAVSVSQKEDKSIKIEGVSVSEGSIAQFITNLRAGNMFDTISITQAESKADTENINFTISAILKGQEGVGNGS